MIKQLIVTIDVGTGATIESGIVVEITQVPRIRGGTEWDGEDVGLADNIARKLLGESVSVLVSSTSIGASRTYARGSLNGHGWRSLVG